jgi:hypothetical protein
MDTIGEEDCPITKKASNPLAHVIFITHTRICSLLTHPKLIIYNLHTFGLPSVVQKSYYKVPSVSSNSNCTVNRKGKYYRNETEKVLTVNTVKYATTETNRREAGRREKGEGRISCIR